MKQKKRSAKHLKKQTQNINVFLQTDSFSKYCRERFVDMVAFVMEKIWDVDER